MSSRKRPLAVTILAILVYIVGIIMIFRGLIFMGVLHVTVFQTPWWGVGHELLLGIAWIVIAISLMTVGSGVWYMKRFALIATLVIAIVGIILGVIGLPATWLTLVICMVLLVLLLFTLTIE